MYLELFIENVKANLDAWSRMAERWFVEDDQRKMSPEDREKVAKMISDFLGRPLKTMKDYEDEMKGPADPTPNIQDGVEIPDI